MSESWKPRLRDLASSISQFAARTEFGGLPPGIRVVRGSGFCGLHLAPGSARIRIGTWKEDVGLMGYWQGRIASQSRLVALMNGTFFYDGGPLGPVVTDGKPVRGIPVAAGRRSRCFLAQITGPATGRTHPPALPDPSAGGDQAALSELDGKKGEMNRLRQDGALPRDPSTGWRWVLGETGRKGGELVSRDFLRNADVFPMPEPGSRLEELLGGGGWIVRDGRDVHMEAYNRQGFRFRREDQDSRHSVAALDSGGGLFLLVFDTGANLSQISHLLRTDRKTFSLIRHAVFFDGGSSSALVLKGQYLVAPMYVLDRARFTAIEVLALPETR